MTLKDYLKETGESVEAFAGRAQSAPGTIHKIVYGQRQPSLGLASRIEIASGGKVTPLDMLLPVSAAA